MDEFKILSIDGGGIRGVFPAVYLNYIQGKIHGSIFEYFDMIVGTSTGAIIALALALNIHTDTILKLYKEKGKKIFPKRLRRLTNGIIFPKYSNKPLIKELKNLYTEKTLGECKTRVCVPTIDIVNGKTIVRKTRHHKSFVHDSKLHVWRIAAESSAAPGYFPAFEDENGCQFIDGGLWANNPSLIGVAEALKIGHDINSIKILSIGTGNKIIHKDGWKTKSLGLIGYGTSIVDITFQAQSQGVNNIARYLLKNNFLRIEHILPDKDKFGLDNINGISSLENFALQRAKETFEEVNSIFLKTKVPTFTPVPQERSI